MMHAQAHAFDSLTDRNHICDHVLLSHSGDSDVLAINSLLQYIIIYIFYILQSPTWEWWLVPLQVRKIPEFDFRLMQYRAGEILVNHY